VSFPVPAKTALRTFALCGPVLLVVVLSGCDIDNYPQDLVYPPRTDPIYPDELLKDFNKNQPRFIDSPGQFPGGLYGQLDPAQVQKRLDPNDVPTAERQKLQDDLTRLFGTPAQPKVEVTDPPEFVQLLKLDPDLLAEGSRVYRQQCLHCHGLTGDGRGPTSPWVNPHPRDYRLGRFKFTSSAQDEGERKPRREDLLRTLREGIDGTSMPAFGLLPDEQLEALVSYVIHLSLRGEAEVFAISSILNKSGETIQDALPVFATRWKEAEDKAIKPEGQPPQDPAGRRESAVRGMRLFLSKGDAGCIGCHIDFGRKPTYSYDAWGTINRPADLTLGRYRGGRRPIDLYYRIHSGINGSGMTAFGKQLKPNDIWDLVTFTQYLPYPQMRKDIGLDID
jgi:mono/diheme cytochrome c family protein